MALPDHGLDHAIALTGKNVETHNLEQFELENWECFLKVCSKQQKFIALK